MLKVKLIQNSALKAFEKEVEKFINMVGPSSIQFRTTAINRVVDYSALIIYEVKEKKDE